MWRGLLSSGTRGLARLSFFSNAVKYGILSTPFSFNVVRNSRIYLTYLNRFHPQFVRSLGWDDVVPCQFGIHDIWNGHKIYNNNIINNTVTFTHNHEGIWGLQKSKFNLKNLINQGFYSGVFNRTFYTGSNTSNKYLTATVVTQLLDSLHRLHNSGYKKEAFQLKSFNTSERPIIGSFVKFQIPVLKDNHVSYHQCGTDVLNDSLLDDMESLISSMERLYNNTSKIFHNYGYLPTETNDGTILRIHFPNKTALETERLISDLEITEGMVYDQTPTAGKFVSDSDVLSATENNTSCDSLDSDIVYLNNFSPVLSQVSL